MSFEGQTTDDVLEQDTGQEEKPLVTEEEMAAELDIMKDAVNEKEGDEMIKAEEENKAEEGPETVLERQREDEEKIKTLQEELRTPPDEDGENGGGGNFEGKFTVLGGQNEKRGGGGMTHESKTEFKTCEVCHGSGRKWFVFNCGVCHGTGRVKSAEISKTKFS